VWDEASKEIGDPMIYLIFEGTTGPFDIRLKRSQEDDGKEYQLKLVNDELTLVRVG
jgi:hypothetical protein